MRVIQFNYMDLKADDIKVSRSGLRKTNNTMSKSQMYRSSFLISLCIILTDEASAPCLRREE